MIFVASNKRIRVMSNTISSNITSLCSVLSKLGRSTFDELQKATRLKDTDLCLAICSLVNDGRLSLQRFHDAVYYELK